jgi:hypothetical protein
LIIIYVAVSNLAALALPMTGNLHLAKCINGLSMLNLSVTVSHASHASHAPNHSLCSSPVRPDGTMISTDDNSELTSH